MSKTDQLNVNLTARQSRAWVELDDPTVREVCYGGAKGGGKSWLLCVWMYTKLSQIAADEQLKPSDNPPHVAWMGRKQGTDFVMTTLQTWQDVIPVNRYEIKSATDKHPKHIVIDGRIAVDFGGLDRQETIQKFNSAEYIIIAVDQAEETTRDDVAVLRATRRMTLSGRKQDYKGFWTANPAQCWLRDQFINSTNPKYKFVPALPGDNPYLPEGYIQTLEEAFGHRPDLLQAYLYGSWDSLSGADQIIKLAWIDEAKIKVFQGVPKRPRLVVDTARFGDDETVIFYMETTDILDQFIMPHCRTTEISDKLLDMEHKYKCPIVVESTGGDLGAGVLDQLAKKGVRTVTFTPQGKTSNDRYVNQRAEAWGETGKAFSQGKISLLYACGSEFDRTKLVNQLTAPTYKFANSGKTMVASKEEIKAQAGWSPDRGDAYVIGIWSYTKVPMLDAYVIDNGDEDEVAMSYGVRSAFV